MIHPKRFQLFSLICLVVALLGLPALAEDGAEDVGKASQIEEKVGTDIVIDNNDSIFFKNDAGDLDGTEIRRFGGNALRFRYRGNAAIFDSLDGFTFKIIDPNGSVRLQLNPIPPSANTPNPLFEVRHNVFPSINLRADTASGSVLAQVAIATSPGFYSSIATTDDVVVRSTGEDLILEASETGAGLRLVTGNTERMTVLPDGKVGIGTADPSEELEVNGNVKLNGSIVSDGDICIGNCP